MRDPGRMFDPADGLYILEGHTPVPCGDVLTWGRWFEATTRRVAETWVTPQVCVSTIFLGLDHQWGAGPPLLFETMVFRADGGPLDQEQERYTTWEEAEQGHAAMVARVQGALAVAGGPACPPGSLCEVCLDAPAVALAPAPWGGDRGVCAACAGGADDAPTA